MKNRILPQAAISVYPPRTPDEPYAAVTTSGSLVASDKSRYGAFYLEIIQVFHNEYGWGFFGHEPMTVSLPVPIGAGVQTLLARQHGQPYPLTNCVMDVFAPSLFDSVVFA